MSRAGLIAAILMISATHAICAESDEPTLSAAEADEDMPKEEKSPWNEYDGKLLTFRLGFGLLIDTADYVQDTDSKEQMNLGIDAKLRDFRFIAKGKFKFAPRFSYSIGYMYDGAIDSWRFRQTGLMIAVPELSGGLFVGRTKEGFSTNKLMVGYHGWANERAAANDAFLPILADGIKWTGTAFKRSLVYNLGWFSATLTSPQSYNKNDKQFAVRAVWLPMTGTKDPETSITYEVLHLALEARYGASLEGNLQYRSKPESFEAQSFAVDTGKFPANGSTTAGIEAYYSPGPLMYGVEYFFNQVSSGQTNNPFFHGGEAFAAFVLTGDSRPYDTRGAFFGAISPARSAFNGGSGAWELLLRGSYVDMNSGLIEGGKFMRITPMVNWHLSDNARLEFAYGYSVLDRFGVKGATQYFQTRLQLTL